ncbi:jg3366 [Pararge aegeria aegeria]|uniref:Jg3366 protein n=1 Tax=Pararge aegeria aegeria TaxID=348720 RepID=A0A8S4RNY7_9NEOP|nr:jg3366 [Pararge aegeria aegeria]
MQVLVFLSTKECYFCGEEDTPRHAIFECPACTDLRSVAQGASSNVDSQSLIARMLSSEEEWQKYAQMLRNIMVRREERERDEKEKRENT